MKIFKRIWFATIIVAIAFCAFSCNNGGSDDGPEIVTVPPIVNETPASNKPTEPVKPADPIESIDPNETFAQYRERIGEYKLLTDYEGTLADGTYVSFGSFPQTIKTVDVTVDESKSEEFLGQTYYKGSDNCWYIKSKARLFTSGTKVFSDGIEVVENEEYYFKIEPIAWRILDESKGFLFSEKALVGGITYYPYKDIIRTIDGQTVYPNNYKESRVRAYLNGLSYVEKESNEAEQTTIYDFENKGFLQIAFTETQQEKIKVSVVDNSAESTVYATDDSKKSTDFVCENTNDKLFLLSEYEITSAVYGFDDYSIYGQESSRIRGATDYAIANYAHQNHQTEIYGGWRWLRSPIRTLNIVSRIAADGNVFVDEGNFVNREQDAIVPALCIVQ